MMLTIIRGRFEAMLGDTHNGVLLKLYKWRGLNCELIASATLPGDAASNRDGIYNWLGTPAAQLLTTGLPAYDWRRKPLPASTRPCLVKRNERSENITP